MSTAKDASAGDEIIRRRAAKRRRIFIEIELIIAFVGLLIKIDMTLINRIKHGDWGMTFPLYLVFFGYF